MASAEEVKTKIYTKILVSHKSPENNCYVPDNEVLVIKSKKNVPEKDHYPYYFVGSKNIKLKSKYGWVKSVEPIDVGTFIGEYCKETINHLEKSDLILLLDSIQKYDENTVVAATYSRKSVFDSKMKLNIHKVLFH